MDTLFEKIKASQNGDMYAREDLVKENTSLVWSIVNKIHSTGYEKEDLFQIGCIGLLKAIGSYDLKHNTKFSTYAYLLILNEIKMFLRDDGPVKISRYDKELLTKVQRARYEFINKTGNEPKISEISKVINIPQEEIAAVLEMKENSKIKYLYEEVSQENDSDMLLIDKIKDEYNEEGKVDGYLTLRQEIAGLEKDEKEVVLLRYYKDKKQQEVAIMMGKTQVQISRLEHKALEKIKKNIMGECW